MGLHELGQRHGLEVGAGTHQPGLAHPAVPHQHHLEKKSFGTLNCPNKIVNAPNKFNKIFKLETVARFLDEIVFINTFHSEVNSVFSPAGGQRGSPGLISSMPKRGLTSE